MFGRSKVLYPWLLAALLATSAMADEVIYFTNGTSLPIRSHRIESEMISVDLGSDARMGFPLYMVDKIESAGRKVFLNPTYYPANQAIAAAPGATSVGEGELAAVPAEDLTMTGEGSVPSRYRNPGRKPAIAGDSDQFVGAGDYAAGRGNSAAGRFRAAGNRSSLSSGSGDIAAESNTQVRTSPRGRSGLVRFSSRTTGAPPAPPATETSDPSVSEAPSSEGSTEAIPADDVPSPE